MLVHLFLINRKRPETGIVKSFPCIIICIYIIRRFPTQYEDGVTPNELELYDFFFLSDEADKYSAKCIPDN